MSKKGQHPIIMFPFEDALPASLRETLHREGFSSQLVTSLDELVEVLKTKKKPILLASCGEREEDSLKITKSLIQRKVLHPHPLLLTGKSIDGFNSVVSRYFEQFLAVPSPVSTQDLISGIRYLIERYPERDSQALSKKEGSSPKKETKILVEPSLTDLNVPTLIFSQLSSLPKEQIGGAELKQKLGLDHLKLLGLVPEKENLKNAVIDVFETLNGWTKEHLCRTTFIADRFNLALGLPTEAQQRMYASALLLPTSFTKHNLNLLKKNYIKGSGTSRKEIATKITESAISVTNDLQEEEIGKILYSVAEFISETRTPTESVDQLLASNLVAAELLDRSCFQDGYWNPRGAYSLMRAASTGKLSMAHPLTVACVIRFLSEAIAHLPQTFMVKRIYRDDPQLQQRAKEAAEYEPMDGESKVPLDSLEPGMRLSKPLYAFDGREILAGDLMLDQDLIWRLWQLSAIRPMNSPMVVEEENQIPE